MKVCEKLKNYGPLPLSNSELLEILLGSKGATKLNKLLQQYDLKDVDINDDSNSNVLRIASLDYSKLKYRGSLTDLETSRIMAAVELGIRIACAGKYESQYFSSASEPSKAAQYLMPKMRYLDHEIVVVLALNTKNSIIGSKIIAQGPVNSASVDVRQIFSYAILSNASAIILAHNHVSGITEPSPEDISLTHLIYSAAIVMNIPLHDHIIIGSGCFYSFHENNMLIPDTTNN